MQTCIMSSLPRCIFRCSVFRYVTLVSFFLFFLFKLCYLIVTLLLWWRINTYLLTYLLTYLIFFLLNPVFVLWAALAILFSNPSIWDFKLSISFDKFLNFLFNLEFLFRLCFSCLLVRATAKGCGTSNSGCWVGSSCCLSSSWRKAINSAFLNQE